MERELGVTEARKAFSDLVDKVQYRGDAYIISRHGKPAAAVVPVPVYESWRQQRVELFRLIREMQAEADLDPSRADQLAAEAVAAVRREDKQGR
jgi:prevent-host-death family protein